MFKETKLFKIFLILSVISASIFFCSSYSAAKPIISKVKPNKVVRGHSIDITVSGRNLDSGGWNYIAFAKKAADLNSSTEKTIWAYPHTTSKTITSTVSVSTCAPTGKYDMYLVNSSYDEEKGKSSVSIVAKKRRALLVKKGKKEPKISRVSPKKIGKGGKAKVTIKGKNLTYGNPSYYWISLSHHSKKKNKEGESVGTGSVKSSSKNKIVAIVSVYTDSLKGKADLSIWGSGEDSNLCVDKKNGITISKNKLKIENVSPTTMTNTSVVTITVSYNPPGTLTDGELTINTPFGWSAPPPTIHQVSNNEADLGFNLSGAPAGVYSSTLNVFTPAGWDSVDDLNYLGPGE
ncbi:MAG: hypothetical protein D6734_07810 [Candidatus Schekmanbacteria bacterium]|nr:MAG: hypothetical protein D6734_07810 [Candidatus Schekmanbacteria bacterium]